jgi:hypothetical protein
MVISMEGSYFQRLSLDETLSRTVAVYKQGLGVFFPLALLTMGASAVVWMFVLIVVMPDPNSDAGNALGLISMLVAVMIGVVGNGAYVRAVGDIYLQREASLGTCIRVGIRNACTMLTASFLGVVGIILGFIVLIIPGVFLMVRWFLVSPIIIVEGLGAVEALKRSWTLVSGSWCYVFCTYIITVVFTMVLQVVWVIVLPSNTNTLAGSIVGSVPSIICGPVSAIMMTIMYINLRIEKEGLNEELFDQNLRESDGGKGGESNYSSLVNRDDDMKQPVSSNIV